MPGQRGVVPSRRRSGHGSSVKVIVTENPPNGGFPTITSLIVFLNYLISFEVS